MSHAPCPSCTRLRAEVSRLNDQLCSQASSCSVLREEVRQLEVAVSKFRRVSEDYEQIHLRLLETEERASAAQRQAQLDIERVRAELSGVIRQTERKNDDLRAKLRQAQEGETQALLQFTSATARANDLERQVASLQDEVASLRLALCSR